jgi:hyperosmotically inducible periplasmic protein
MNSSKRFALILAGFALSASALAQTDANSTARPNSPENQPQPSSTQSPTAVPSRSHAPEQEQTSTSSDQPVSDAWITMKVKSELATTKDIKSMDISVKTQNGIVQLSGTQPNDMAVHKAVATAKGIKGVQRVDASGLKSQSSSTRQ